MGLFDDIICDCLPGEPPSYVQDGHRFQTKDLDNDMTTYLILEGQELSVDGEPFTGAIEFYTSNIRGCGAGVFTENGEDAESVEYKAVFDCGNLKSIEETSREVEPAFPIKTMTDRLNKKVSRQIEFNQEASQKGETVYVLWGGRQPGEGYSANIIAENDKELVLESERGFETIHRIQLGRTVFESQEQGDSHRQVEIDTWKSEQQEYDEFVKSRSM